jgi:cytochrome c556
MRQARPGILGHWNRNSAFDSGLNLAAGALALAAGTISNVAMKYGNMNIRRQAASLALGLASCGHICLPGTLPAAEPNETVTLSLHSTLAKNIGHARNWLDQADYKSLNQSAGGLQLLAELLKARSEDAAWQTALAKVEAAVAEVQAAAKGEDATQCRAALGSLEKSASEATALTPNGKQLSPPRVPAIRPLMLVMDGVYADAKIALVSGNVEAAKNQAVVLSELGGLVSNSRQADEWHKLAGEFTAAANAAAATKETDPQAVRQLLRGISQKCEACHETRTR